MSSDSYLFKTYDELTQIGGVLDGNTFYLPGGDAYVPLYEGKMIWHYNHHYGTWPTGGERPNAIDSPAPECLANPSDSIIPWYWVPQTEVENRKVKTNSDGDILWKWNHSWLLGYRCLTNSTNERTFIMSLIPAEAGVGNSIVVAVRLCGKAEGWRNQHEHLLRQAIPGYSFRPNPRGPPVGNNPSSG